MISPHDQQCIMGEHDDGNQFQRGPFPTGHHADGCMVVSSVPPELSPCRRTPGGARAPIDHATIQRWVVKYSPQLEAAFHRRKRWVWISWRMDETSIKVK